MTLPRASRQLVALERALRGKSFFAKPKDIGVPRYFAMSCGPEPMNEPLDPTVLLRLSRKGLS